MAPPSKTANDGETPDPGRPDASESVADELAALVAMRRAGSEEPPASPESLPDVTDEA